MNRNCEWCNTTIKRYDDSEYVDGVGWMHTECANEAEHYDSMSRSVTFAEEAQMRMSNVTPCWDFDSLVDMRNDSIGNMVGVLLHDRDREREMSIWLCQN